jgi:hypothetical protein
MQAGQRAEPSVRLRLAVMLLAYVYRKQQVLCGSSDYKA